MKRILVSGAGGFLGSELINQLVRDPDVYTIALSRQKEKLRKQYGAYPNFEFASEFPQDVDIFINCVFPANANGTQMANGLDHITNLYQKAKMQNAGAVINISTQSVYCQNKAEPATEESVPDLGTKYAVGKYAVEKLTNAIFCDRPHTNLRMASLIGPNSDTRISNRFVKQVIAGKDVRIVADRQDFGFLDVRDAAEAIAKYAKLDTDQWQETINLGSGCSYSLREVAECVLKVGEAFGYHSVLIIGNETGDVRNSMLDTGKLEKTLNWKAQIPLEQTIRDAFAHYRDEMGESEEHR